MSHWHPLPPQILQYVQETPGTVLLHSSRSGESFFSRIFADPIEVIEVRELGELAGLFSTVQEAVGRGQFAAGYFSYECGAYFEPAVELRRRGGGSELLVWFGIYKEAHTFDHRTGRFDAEFLPGRLADAQIEAAGSGGRSALTFGVDEVRYTQCIEKIHDWIRAGDVYQLNFTFPVQLSTGESAAALYARLAAAQPVDYGAFLHTRAGQYVLSFSPELFFRIDKQRRITTRPMKGTAPRGRNTAEDRVVSRWLAEDEKNRAENVMIVDLIRNDLGRICSFGSVRVDSLFDVSCFPSLWQMTSSVSGTLRAEVGYEQIFRALFPCGSVTGAPKIRAMQLLAEIEQEPRGVYTGAIGCFSREDTVFNVAIRTLEVEKGTGRGGVGSGIVIDSEPAAEYRECRLKSEFLSNSAEPFSLIETMLWNGGFPLLDLHLERLADSAEYMGFPCDRGAIRDRLLKEASRFAGDERRKVRLLLDGDGSVEVQAEVIEAEVEAPPRVCMAGHRTDSADRILFHKTTRREVYNRAYRAAQASGFADALFLNTREEVSEGAVHNIFIERSGRWFTPPLDCGVLPGVYRRHLLATRPDIEEKVLSVDELKAADGVYICNAVRGLRRVMVDFERVVSF